MTPARFVISLLSTVAVNTVIAAVLHAIGFGKGFRFTFVFSQCIGLSIHLISILAGPVYKKMRRTASQLAIIILSIIVGGITGSLLGAVGNGIDPITLARDNATLMFQVILLAVLFGFIVSYVFISLQIISEEKLQRLEAEKASVQTELKLLQSQMEPHFLFNTLSNILSLIQTDPERASRMLESFTSFLRSSFLTARHTTVTLAQEMDVVRNYLAVFSVRMGDRLRYTIDVPESLNDFLIPPLLIQPLVENAIKHGLEPATEGGTITIQASKEGPALRISVLDSGIGLSEKAAGGGIGLENIRKRLDLAYGGRGRLVFEENHPRGMRVVIEIPYETN